MIIPSPLVANVLPIINLPMGLANLPIAANGLPLVPMGNDMQVIAQHMVITYTSIVYMTQAGFLSANAVYLAYLYCV